MKPHASSWKQTLQCIAADVHEGFVQITRHGMAVLGLAVAAVAIAFGTRPTLQTSANDFLMGWLQSRQIENSEVRPANTGAQRATALPIQDLTHEQLSVSQWLSRKYRVSQEPMAALVAEAWDIGLRSNIPPTLILAVIGAESSFNPFAQRSEHARGLMQIESQSQAASFNHFGGQLSAFDPLTNLRVGSRMLQAAIQHADSLEEGLRHFARNSSQSGDASYVHRILGEHQLLERLMQTQATSAAATGSGGTGRL